MTKAKVTIYTDGSCLGNPGRGGWSAIMVWQEKEKELSQGYVLTTNNRMELMAVIEALRALKRPCIVNLHTDSRYVCDAIEKKWIDTWIQKNWRTAAKKPVKNVDLWQKLLPLLEKHLVSFHWVEGHSGHSQNERCDQLAKKAASSNDLLTDEGFISENTETQQSK